jgi:hypothetical protein
VVDAQQGPGLQLDLAGAELSVPDGSATEALRSVSVTVGSLAGPSQITNPSARRLTVPALAQAVINGDALPAATTPLHLSDSAAESHAVPTLVDDDNRLRVLARGIDSSGVTTAHTIDASWGGPTTTLPPRALPSESALPIVIADATSGGTLQDRYRHVVQWRRAGGSWGVALELLRGHAGSVESKLLALQHSLPAGQIGHITSVAALTAPHAPGGGGPQPRPTTGPTGTPTSPPPTTGPGGHGGGPKPTPSQGPVGKVAGTVGGVVKTVIGLLPVKKVLHRLPVPSKSSGGLGGLLRSGH